MRPSPFRITSAALLCLALFTVLCSKMLIATSASQPYPFEGARRHLYVSDAGGHVFVIPFQRNGLPSSTPEAVLSAGVGPGGLAFDSQNDLYVVSTVSQEARIFAPGPHGATRLIRTYQFSDTDPTTVEVDPLDYVYVGNYPDSGGSDISIYPPGLGDPSKPVAQIFIAKYVGDFTIDRTGALYARTVGNADIIVYSHPLVSQVPDGTIAPPNGYYLFDNWSGVAVDRDNQLRFVVNTLNPQPWGNADFDVHDLARNVPDRLILTRDCTGEDGYPGLGNGAAVRQPYLFYACYSDGVVLVYRADIFGKQPAVMRIGGPIQQPNNVIVGF